MKLKLLFLLLPLFHLALSGPKSMELAIFIDEHLWNEFLDRYGKGDAQTKLETYVGVLLNMTRVAFHDRSLYPKLDIHMVHFEIWKKQPRALRQKRNYMYLYRFCSHIRPKRRGYDHATLMTSVPLITGSGATFIGKANLNSVCTDKSCSILRFPLRSYSYGHILAQQLGHSVGLYDDDVTECDPHRKIMADPIDNSPRWSKCSNKHYRKILRQADCLNDHLTPRNPTNLANLPGQVFPDEAQCHLVRTCFRHIPGNESDCSISHCSRDKNSTRMFARTRLDGTYCGPGKICKGGECIRIRSHLQAVDGGWSAWRSINEKTCGDGKCSDCGIRHQRSVRVETRTCDAPYPNNGGKPCQGNLVRGVKCHGSQKPQTCRSSSFLFDSKKKYMLWLCRWYQPCPHSQIDLDTPCNLSHRYDDYFDNIGPWMYPDGIKCGKRSRGRCVQGFCMYHQCHSSDYYVSSRKDCP